MQNRGVIGMVRGVIGIVRGVIDMVRGVIGMMGGADTITVPMMDNWMRPHLTSKSGGGAGSNVINRLVSEQIGTIETLAINTDHQALRAGRATHDAEGTILAIPPDHTTRTLSDLAPAQVRLSPRPGLLLRND